MACKAGKDGGRECQDRCSWLLIQFNLACRGQAPWSCYCFCTWATVQLWLAAAAAAACLLSFKACCTLHVSSRHGCKRLTPETLTLTLSFCAATAERLIHFSDMGASPNHPSRRMRTKAAGDAELREVFPNATIFKPSPIMGDEDDFLNNLLFQVCA